MKDKIINYLMNTIKNKYPNKDNDEIDKIHYGLVAIYLLVSKLIVIIPLVFILGIFKEFILFFFIFNFIRAFSFGIHASKSSYCLISSLLIFIVIPYLNINLYLNNYIKIITGIFLILFIYKYSPADTVKKPIISIRRRNNYKFISTIIAIIYVFLSLFINNNLMANTLLSALFIEVVLINPITYKVFKLPYNNYLNYRREDLC